MVIYSGQKNNRVATPESWARFTEDNIRRSASERAQSDDFMNLADNLLKETAEDMWNQFNTVNEAFEQRVHETNEAKNKIQNHLSAVCNIQLYIFLNYYKAAQLFSLSFFQIN